MIALVFPFLSVNCYNWYDWFPWFSDITTFNALNVRKYGGY